MPKVKHCFKIALAINQITYKDMAYTLQTNEHVKTFYPTVKIILIFKNFFHNPWFYTYISQSNLYCDLIKGQNN